MSLLFSRLSRLRHGKPVSIRSSFVLLSNGFSSSVRQIPPFEIWNILPCGEDMGKLVISTYGGNTRFIYLEKKVPLALKEEMGTIGASHGWVATLKPGGMVSLQDDLNPVASDTNPKRISLPPFVTLPDCQTQIITNMAMSSSSPEDEDCVVAFKFMGPQLSFCKPGQSNPEWVNIKIQNRCFFSSPVMFSKKDNMFRIPGSGGNLIGSWDLHEHKHSSKIQKLRFKNLPELTQTQQELLDSCSRSEHLVESRATGETFLIKLYKKNNVSRSIIKKKTSAVMVFKLDEKGNAVYTDDIGDLCIYLSKSEPFGVLKTSSSPGYLRNGIFIYDVDEYSQVYLPCSRVKGHNCEQPIPYFFPPQNIV